MFNENTKFQHGHKMSKDKKTKPKKHPTSNTKFNHSTKIQEHITTVQEKNNSDIIKTNTAKVTISLQISLYICWYQCLEVNKILHQ